MNYPQFKSREVAFDIESKDMFLAKKGKRPSLGAGSHRHYLEGEDSYILCVSFSDSENDYCFDACPELFQWMRSIQDKHLFIAHNIFYDMSWLYYEGFRPKESADTVGLIRLLFENRLTYSLESCGKDYLGYGKKKDETEQWCLDNGFSGDPREHLWRMPSELVHKYAKMDTRLTYELYMKFIPEIEKQGLSYIWQIERELLPILFRTHHKGLRIDNQHREKQISLALEKEAELQGKIDKIVGFEGLNIGSSKQLKPVFDAMGLPYSVTDKGNPSFKSEELLPYGVEPREDYLPHIIVELKKLSKLRRDFLEKLELFMVKGRIHPTINPYGTKTGRPTSTSPNIFQIPKRGKGKKICRPLFLPEEGELFVSADYASEEFRVFAHYARGKGSDEYRRLYNETDDFDMHLHNAAIAECDRPKAKTIGLGVMFGMGKKKLSSNLGLSESAGMRVLEKFHSKNPSFMKTSKDAQIYAEKFGYIRTISGRKRRFPNGEGAYKALNFLTQGNSGDIAKISIVEAERQGLWEKMNFLFWLYDEYDLSVHPDNLEYYDKFREIAENAIPMKVRMKLDYEAGTNWGTVQ